MKRKTIGITLGAIIMLGLAGCASKGEKMLKLVRADLAEQVPNLEDYTPLETLIDTAKNVYIYDSIIMQKGIVMAVAKDAIDSVIDELHNLDEYAFSHDFRIRMIMNGLNECYLWHRAWSSALDTVRMLASDIDTTQVIGWRVTQTFKYKDDNGDRSTMKTVHIIDKDIKRILYREQPDFEMVQKCYKMIDDATLYEKPPIYLGYRNFVAVSPMGIDSIGISELNENRTPESLKVFSELVERLGGNK